MPCDCSHLEPTALEEESQQVAKHIRFVNRMLKQTTPTWILAVAGSAYGSPESADSLTAYLCELCAKMTAVQKAAVIYDGRNKKSRKLADWWDKHKQSDLEKKKEQARAKAHDLVVKNALEKLTLKEIKALGL